MSYDVKVFSLKSEGEKYLSKNFQVKEFACNDGSDIVIINMNLVKLLQAIRDHYNVRTKITSSYRTVAYNKRVNGSSSESQHCYGNAADISVEGIKPYDVAKFVETLIPYSGGIGRYQTFTHVDVRSVKARWNG